MQSQQKAEFDALVEAQWFLDDNAEELGEINQSRSRAELDTIIEALEASRGEQAAATDDGRRRTTEKNEIRRRLYVHHLLPIAAIARVELEGRPLCTVLRSPARRVSDALFLVRAAMVAEAAAQYRPVFIAHGLEGDFVAGVRAAVAAMHWCIAQRVASWARRRAATKNVDRHLRRARRVMVALDALVVRQLFYRRPELLRAWYVARHKRPRRRIARARLRKVA